MPRVRVALCAVAAAVVLAGSCHRGPAGGTLERARQRGYLTWGADKQGGEPYLWEEAGTGVLVGFEVDLMDAIGRRLGVEIRFVHYDWSRLLDGLDRGDFDVAMNGLEATPERADRALLSAPYFIYDETLTFRTARPYRTLAELAGKPVGTLDQCYA